MNRYHGHVVVVNPVLLVMIHVETTNAISGQWTGPQNTTKDLSGVRFRPHDVAKTTIAGIATRPLIGACDTLMASKRPSNDKLDKAQ